MQAAERARELERVYQSRRGHAPQISISDDNHHVTEAIGDMYGGEDEYLSVKRSSRPLSFISSPLGDALEAPLSPPFPTAPPKSPLRAHMSNDHQSPSAPAPPNGTSSSPGVPPRRSSSGRAGANGPFPPSLSRTNSDTAEQQFPLNDIDYESSPASLAQELSNLQAIRRMSMDVNTADPDLPSFKSVAPQHFSEDDDPTKLFWVPARLHPELAPKEFKTFIEEKVDTIRRRSGDAESLSPDGPLGRQTSGGGLRRKKSMLSRQIDGPSGYRDGAERLERQRSHPNGGLPDLQESEHMADPASLIRRMSIDTTGRKSADGDASGDIPILPGAPAALKRSTRTNYRRGSIRRGERVPFARRIGTRQHETDTEESPVASPTFAKEPDFFNQGLQRVQSEPVNSRFESPENFSRPTRKRSIPIEQRPSSPEEVSASPAVEEPKSSHPVKPFHSRIASNGRTTAPLPGYNPQQIPQIIETPPPQEPTRNKSQMQLPERHSSRGPPPSKNSHQPPSAPRSQSQPQIQQRQPAPRQNRHAQAAQASPIKPQQSYDDLSANPSHLPGNGTRTDNLSIIPNLTEDRKPDKKSKDKGSEGGSRKTSWGWLLGSDDKEKEKKEKEDRDKEMAKKVKNKLSKTQDKSHDNTRLDVLQHSIDGSRGRESVVLDRDNVKLEEERKKESSRKSSSSDTKKEKEAGLFSSIFGGSKKKGEKELSHKKGTSMRGLSPEPPPRILKPDIDYNWTRFSILEERAIYRMAHIKLANPRRELYSQVLLSNFMYSYLAKVQQMHPQIQIGTSAQAKQQQKQAAAKEKKEQPEEFTQYQRYQQTQEPIAEKGGQSPNNGHHADNHGSEHEDDNQYRPDSRASQHSQQHHQQQHQQQPRDSHHSGHNNANGSYSVADSKSYLGVSGSGKSQQSYYGYDDSDQSSRDDDMW